MAYVNDLRGIRDQEIERKKRALAAERKAATAPQASAPKINAARTDAESSDKPVMRKSFAQQAREAKAKQTVSPQTQARRAAKTKVLDERWSKRSHHAAENIMRLAAQGKEAPKDMRDWAGYANATMRRTGYSWSEKRPQQMSYAEKAAYYQVNKATLPDNFMQVLEKERMTPGNRHYDPYARNTSNNDEARALFGRDTFDQAFFQENRPLYRLLEWNASRTSPLAPTKKGNRSSADYAKAYKMWQLETKDEPLTRDAEAEMVLLREAIARRAAGGGTADEVWASVIDDKDFSDKYPALDKLRSAQGEYSYKLLNRPVHAGDESIRAMIDAALRGEDISQDKDYLADYIARLSGRTPGAAEADAQRLSRDPESGRTRRRLDAASSPAGQGSGAGGFWQDAQAVGGTLINTAVQAGKGAVSWASDKLRALGQGESRPTKEGAALLRAMGTEKEMKLAVSQGLATQADLEAELKTRAARQKALAAREPGEASGMLDMVASPTGAAAEAAGAGMSYKELLAYRKTLHNQIAGVLDAYGVDSPRDLPGAVREQITALTAQEQQLIEARDAVDGKMELSRAMGFEPQPQDQAQYEALSAEIERVRAQREQAKGDIGRARQYAAALKDTDEGVEATRPKSRLEQALAAEEAKLGALDRTGFTASEASRKLSAYEAHRLQLNDEEWADLLEQDLPYEQFEAALQQRVEENLALGGVAYLRYQRMSEEERAEAVRQNLEAAAQAGEQMGKLQAVVETQAFAAYAQAVAARDEARQMVAAGDPAGFDLLNARSAQLRQFTGSEAERVYDIWDAMGRPSAEALKGNIDLYAQYAAVEANSPGLGDLFLDTLTGGQWSSSKYNPGVGFGSTALNAVAAGGWQFAKMFPQLGVLIARGGHAVADALTGKADSYKNDPFYLACLRGVDEIERRIRSQRQYMAENATGVDNMLFTAGAETTRIMASMMAGQGLATVSGVAEATRQLASLQELNKLTRVYATTVAMPQSVAQGADEALTKLEAGEGLLRSLSYGTLKALIEAATECEVTDRFLTRAFGRGVTADTIAAGAKKTASLGAAALDWAAQSISAMNMEGMQEVLSEIGGVGADLAVFGETEGTSPEELIQAYWGGFSASLLMQVATLPGAASSYQYAQQLRERGEEMTAEQWVQLYQSYVRDSLDPELIQVMEDAGRAAEIIDRDGRIEEQVQSAIDSGALDRAPEVRQAQKAVEAEDKELAKIEADMAAAEQEAQAARTQAAGVLSQVASGEISAVDALPQVSKINGQADQALDRRRQLEMTKAQRQAQRERAQAALNERQEAARTQVRAEAVTQVDQEIAAAQQSVEAINQITRALGPASAEADAARRDRYADQESAAQRQKRAEQLREQLAQEVEKLQASPFAEWLWQKTNARQHIAALEAQRQRQARIEAIAAQGEVAVSEPVRVEGAGYPPAVSNEVGVESAGYAPVVSNAVAVEGAGYAPAVSNEVGVEAAPRPAVSGPVRIEGAVRPEPVTSNAVTPGVEALAMLDRDAAVPGDVVQQSLDAEGLPSTGVRLNPDKQYSAGQVEDLVAFRAYDNPQIRVIAEPIYHGKALTWEQKNRRVPILPVSADAAERIKELTGIDVSRKQHKITGGSIVHIFKRHGPKGEHDRSMADINDVARIGYILEHYDTIERATTQNGKPVFSKLYRGSDGRRAPVVNFIKRLDGTVYITEAVPDTQRGEVLIISAYTQKGQKKKGAQTPDAGTAPGITSESGVASPFVDPQGPGGNAPGFPSKDGFASSNPIVPGGAEDVKQAEKKGVDSLAMLDMDAAGAELPEGHGYNAQYHDGLALTAEALPESMSLEDAIRAFGRDPQGESNIDRWLHGLEKRAKKTGNSAVTKAEILKFIQDERAADQRSMPARVKFERELMRHAPANIILAPSVSQTKRGADESIGQWAKRLMRSYNKGGGTVTVESQEGTAISVNAQSIEKTFSQAKEEHNVPLTMSVVPALDKLIKNAIYIGSHYDYSDGDRPVSENDQRAMHYFVAAANIDGPRARVLLSVKTTQRDPVRGTGPLTNKLYLERVEIIDAPSAPTQRLEPEGSRITGYSGSPDAPTKPSIPNPPTDVKRNEKVLERAEIMIPSDTTSTEHNAEASADPSNSWITEGITTISIPDLLTGVNLNKMKFFDGPPKANRESQAQRPGQSGGPASGGRDGTLAAKAGALDSATATATPSQEYQPPSQVIKRVKRASEIKAQLTKALGIPHTSRYQRADMRTGATLGEYERHSGVVVTRAHQDLNALAHEVGHALFDRVKAFDGLTPRPAWARDFERMRSNLPQRFVQTYSAAGRADHLYHEAGAEFTRLYLTDRNQAAAFAGEDFVRRFESEVLRSGAERRAMQRARTQAVNLLTAAGLDRSMAMNVSRRDARPNRQLWHRFLTGVFDKYHSFIRFDLAAKRQGYDNSEAGKRVYTYMSNLAYSSDRAGNIVNKALTAPDGRMVAGSLAGLLSSRVKHRDMTAFNTYLTLKHDIDRQAQGKPVYGGQSAQESETQLRLLDAQHPEFAQAQQALTAWWNAFIDEWVVKPNAIPDARETIARFRQLYPNYVPTYRSDVDSADVMEAALGDMGGALVDAGPRFRGAKGSDKAIVSPIESFVIRVQEIVSGTDKVLAMRKMHEVIQEVPGLGEFAREVDAPAPGTRDEREAVKVLDAQGGQHYYQILDPVMYAVLQGSPQEMGGIFRAIGKVTGVFKQLTTMRNPFFAISNAMRDYIEAYTKGSAWTPVEFTAQWISALAELTREAFTGRGSETLARYRAAGGGDASIAPTGSAGVSAMEQAMYGAYFRDSFARIVRGKDFAQRVRGPVDGLRGFERKLAGVIDAANNVIEGSQRYAEFKRQVKKGAGDAAAFRAGMDVTTDFRRSGSSRAMKEAGQVFAFMNAGLQGVYSIYRMAQEGKFDKKQFAGRLVKSLTMFGLAPVLLRLFIRGDDEDEQAYQLMAENVKQDNYLIPKSWFGGREKGEFIKIPKPNGPIAAMGDAFGRALQEALEQEDGLDAFLQYELADYLQATGGQMLDALNPYSSPIFAPVIQLMMNRTWYGAPIESAWMENDNLAKELRVKDSTSSVGIWMANLPGIKGWLSPIQWDYLINQSFGVLGDLALSDAGDALVNKLRGGGEWRDVLKAGGSTAAKMALSRVRTDPTAASDMTSAMYDMADYFEGIVADVDDAGYSPRLNERLTLSEQEAAVRLMERATKKGGVLYQAKRNTSAYYDDIEAILAGGGSDEDKALKVRDLKYRMLMENAAVVRYCEEYVKMYVKGTPADYKRLKGAA